MQYESVNVVCPFYLGHSKDEIECEAIFANGIKTEHKFPNSSERMTHMSKFCNRDYKCCAFCAALYEKYGGSDG